jgi:hypothetical protein
MAIHSCGSILQEYDTDKQLAMYGFGARLQGQRATNHCFHVNMNPATPNVHETSGMLAAYANSLNYLSLSGPTYFGEILEAAVQRAQEAEQMQQETGQQQYTVLMILTDGYVVLLFFLPYSALSRTFLLCCFVICLPDKQMHCSVICIFRNIMFPLVRQSFV